MNKPVQAVTPSSVPTTPPPLPLQTGAPLVELPLTPAHPGEVMRVIREPQTGRILVEVNGQRYAHIREIQDAQIGRRVLWAIADLLRFTGGMAANPQALKSVAPPEETPAPTRPDETTVAVQPAQSLPQPERAPTPYPLRLPAAPSPTTSAPTLKTAPSGVAKIGKTVTTFFQRGLEPAQKVEIVPFIAQIEAILQRRIEALPEPLPVEVHVQSAPDGTLQIEIGFQIYHSPAEVPDPKIRQLIQDAVAEWERR